MTTSTPPAGPQPAPAPAAEDIITAIDLWGQVISGFETTNRRLHAAIKSAFNLNEAEAETLLNLHRQAERRAPLSVLSRAAMFSTGGFTKIADKLTKRGLTERAGCAEDRRVTYLELTEAGIELAGELACLVAEINRAQFIEVLGAEQARQVAEAMTKLHQANRDAGR